MHSPPHSHGEGSETSEEGAIEFQRRVNNVKETIVINTKDNPKY